MDHAQRGRRLRFSATAPRSAIVRSALLSYQSFAAILKRTFATKQGSTFQDSSTIFSAPHTDVIYQTDFKRDSKAVYIESTFSLIFSIVAPVLFIFKLYISIMARIQYTALVSQMRGKIGGTVLSKISTGYTAYRKGQPRKQASAAQLNKRRGLAHNARRWAAVSPADKLAWASIAAARTFTDRIGEPVHLNAFELYRKIMQSINPDGYQFSMVPNPTIDPAQEISFDVSGLEVDLTNNGYYIDRLDGTGETINATTAGQVRVVYISLPLGADENYYSRTWYRVRTGFPAGINSIGQSFNWNANAVLMPKGWYTFDGARHRVMIQYIVPQGGWFSVEHFAEVTSQLNVPFSFPSISIWTDPVTGPSPFYNQTSNRLQGQLFYELSGGDAWVYTDFDIEVSLGQLTATGVPATGASFMNPRYSPVVESLTPAVYQLGGADPWNNLINWYSNSININPPAPVGMFFQFRIRLYHIPTATWQPYQYLTYQVVGKTF